MTIMTFKKYFKLSRDELPHLKWPRKCSSINLYFRSNTIIGLLKTILYYNVPHGTRTVNCQSIDLSNINVHAVVGWIADIKIDNLSQIVKNTTLLVSYFYDVFIESIMENEEESPFRIISTVRALNSALRLKIRDDAETTRSSGGDRVPNEPEKLWFKESSAKNLRNRDFLSPNTVLTALYESGQVRVRHPYRTPNVVMLVMLMFCMAESIWIIGTHEWGVLFDACLYTLTLTGRRVVDRIA